jgi:hypothetical protein
LLKTLKNKKKNKFIVSERQYIGILATINGLDQLWHLMRLLDLEQRVVAG